MGNISQSNDADPVGATIFCAIDGVCRFQMDAALIDKSLGISVEKASPWDGRVMIGRHRHLVIFSDSKYFADDIDDVDSSDLLSASYQDSLAVDIRRFFSTYFEVKISREDKRDKLRIRISSKARDLGLLPGAGENVAVICLPGFIEIWRADRLIDHLADRSKLVISNNE